MKFVSALIAASAVGLVSTAQAEVKSLTSDELTETYIQDSTIIITPSQRRERAKREKLRSYSISPGEEVVTEVDILEEVEESNRENDQQVLNAIEAEERARLQAFIEETQLPPIPELTNPSINVPNFPGLTIPAGDFNQSVIPGQLGVDVTGDTFTLSIGGNLPGVDAINLPNGASNDQVQIVPRFDGGVDLIFQIPE